MLDCNLAIELNKAGVETDVYQLYPEASFGGTFMKGKLTGNGIGSVRFLNGPQSFVSLIKFIRFCSKEKYQVVISQINGSLLLIWLAKAFFKFRHIVFFHTYFKRDFPLRLQNKLRSILIRKADGYIAISDYVKNINRDVFSIKKPMRTIYNSIDISLPDEADDIRKKSGIPEDSRIILSCGRIEVRKGFDFAAKYMAPLLKNEVDLYWIICGDEYRGRAVEKGLVGYVPEFKALLESYGISNKTIFMGFQENMKGIMKQCDLLVHLARHEGFGLVLLEAIASGIPIIASNTGGIPEVLAQTPYDPIPLDDEKEFSIKIKRYLTMSKDDLAKITAKAKEILPLYTHARRAKEVKEFMEELCAV